MTARYRLCRRPAHGLGFRGVGADARVSGPSCRHPVLGAIDAPKRRCADSSLPPPYHSVLTYRSFASSRRSCGGEYTRIASAVADAAASRRIVVRARHHYLGAARCRRVGMAAQRSRGGVARLRGRYGANAISPVITTHSRLDPCFAGTIESVRPQAAHRLPVQVQGHTLLCVPHIEVCLVLADRAALDVAPS